MLLVAKIIALSVVLELLWKSTLLVCYKLNIFRPPQVNHFDIRALLFGGYARFILLDRMVFYGDLERPDLWKFFDVTLRFKIVSVV